MENEESSSRVIGHYIGETEIHSSGQENVPSAKSPTIKLIQLQFLVIAIFPITTLHGVGINTPQLSGRKECKIIRITCFCLDRMLSTVNQCGLQPERVFSSY